MPLALAAQVGLALRKAKRAKEAVVFLTAQHLRAPGDFWINARLSEAARAVGEKELCLRHATAALAAQPAYARAWGWLGHALLDKGEFDAAIRAYEKAAALEPVNDMARKHLHRARLTKRLPAVLAGTDRPADWREMLAFAELALHQRKDASYYSAALRLYRQALETEPRLTIDPHKSARYNAACAGSLAGKGSHEQALTWLRADLALWTEAVAQNAGLVAQSLADWQKDPDLAPIRDAKDLPDDFKKLWADVDALRKRAQENAK